MQIDYILILIIGVLQIIIGAIWYGGVFGKIWMKLNRLENISKEEMEKSKKAALPNYFINLFLSLITVYILAIIIKNTPDMRGEILAIAMWLGFVMPTQGAMMLWDSHKNNFEKLNLFMISAGYQLLVMIMSGYLLTNFG